LIVVGGLREGEKKKVKCLCEILKGSTQMNLEEMGCFLPLGV